MRSWSDYFAKLLRDPEFRDLQEHIYSLYLEAENGDHRPIYPDYDDIWAAFDLCPYEDTRVVILGQDPYHTPNVADGLAFSTRQERIPPSARRLINALHRDTGHRTFHFELSSWARQGVLLLNTALTVVKGCPESHLYLWRPFTLQLLRHLAKRGNIVFLLMGNQAQETFRDAVWGLSFEEARIATVLTPHPSPFTGRAFEETTPFKSVNESLQSLGLPIVDWSLPKNRILRPSKRNCLQLLHEEYNVD